MGVHREHHNGEIRIKSIENIQVPPIRPFPSELIDLYDVPFKYFRVVRLRKFSEQEDIQKEAMVPSKEAKLFTYKLLEEHFLQVTKQPECRFINFRFHSKIFVPNFQTKTVRKQGGGGTGMAKSFFLFYVSQTQIVSMLLEICYKSLFNSMTRSAYNKSENRRLIEKSQRLDGIVEAMKERGESEEYIAEVGST